MNRTMSGDNQDNNCVVCCRRLSIYAIGECDHPVCYQCATRMRVLCKQNDCAICRKELPKMIFCNERLPYRELQDMHFTLKDSRHKLYFVDIDIQKAFYKLLENRCQFCDSRPTYASFHSLKEHVRKEHERHFCDLCVEHLMVFTFERKCYSRADLARHRRVGDVDDTSHRGHPLCEFCDTRYLDEDELYKHLRREHFYCHFCDADGLHHYYSDYEYLREHFRQEHFLCEEGDCINEKFTTVFRSEIDLKAHRTTVHNKNLSKAQMKQARTLELEFTIAPRSSQPPRNGGFSRENKETEQGFNGENVESRSGFRRGYRRGENRDDYRSKRHNDEVEFVGPPKVPEPSPKIDMNDSQAFPSLSHVRSGAPDSLGSAVASGSSSDTMAQKLAKINRFSVGKKNVNGDEEFPALGPSAGGKAGGSSSANQKSERATSSSKTAPSWGSSTSASVSLTSSAVPSSANVTKKTLTFKLNSKDEFPGLQNTSKRMVAPSTVSFHMTHNVKPAPMNNPSASSLGINVSNISNGKKNDERAQTIPNNKNSTGKANPPPVVTRVTSTQNITFIDPPTTPNTFSTSSKEANNFKENVAKVGTDNADAANGLSRTESGWYVLKKGKCTKTDDPIVNVPGKDEFPELEKGKLKMRFKESAVPVSASSAWKSTNSNNTDSGIDAEVNEPNKSNGKKKKKSKDQLVADDNSSSAGTSNENGKKKKKANPSTFEKLKKLIEIHSHELVSSEDLEDSGDDMKQSELKINKSSSIREPGENEKNDQPKFNDNDWPAIDDSKEIIKPLSAVPPPGFQTVEKNPIKPPPGFTPSVAKPPPGFRSPLAMLTNCQTQPSVTFTNSSGQDFTLSSMANDSNAKFIPLPEFNERNQQLMRGIVQLLGGENERFVLFVETSGLFRRNEISAKEYYEFCLEMMGKDQFGDIFSELLVLLPDIGKQQELLSAHKELKYKTKGKTENGEKIRREMLFLVCPTCQQVLCSQDFHNHQRGHDVYRQ